MKQVDFVQTSEQDAAEGFKFRIGRLAADAVQMFVAMEILLWSLFAILGDEFADWQLPPGGFRTIQCFLAATIVLFGIVAPLAGRYRALACVGLELVCIVLGIRYIMGHAEQLRGGLMAMYAQYLVKWNLYYKTNLFVGGGDHTQIGTALLFVVLLMLILVLLLYYVTALRWPLLLLPLAALLPGFLVDVLPKWQGLALYFAGTVVLYAGTEVPARYRVLPARAKDVEGAVRGRLGAMLLAAVVAIAVLEITERAFGGAVERIPEKMQEFLAIQKELETKLANLGDSLFPADRAYVDNATPKYEGKQVLEITADGMPDTNLYLGDFYSGDYRNGRWKQSDRAYRKASEAAGVNTDRFGLLLWQTPYEEGTGESAQTLVNLGNIRNYRIDYKVSTNRAFLPYFSDVAGMDGRAWVENEGVTRKRRAEKSLEFVGAGANLNVVSSGTVGYFFTDSLEEFLREQPDALTTDSSNWYSGYVQESYVKESGIAAVQEAVARLKEANFWSPVQISMSAGQTEEPLDYDVPAENQDSADVKTVNAYRVALADMVQGYLSQLAEYNLYLDRIPAGTDTIQYFLATGHEGYCMHFASAGTLILQELGVPARYASGYIVKRYAFKRSAENQRAYSAPVYDRNAHAWVEIYLEDVGWIPYEMTPGYLSPGDGLPTEEGNQELLQNKHANKTPVQTETESESEGESEGGAESESESETESESGGESGGESETGFESETEGGTKTEDKADSPQRPSGGSGDASSGSGSSSGSGGDGAAKPGIGRQGLRLVLIVAGILALLVLCFAAVCTGMRRYREVLRREIRRKQHRRAIRRINRRIYRRLPKGIVRRGMTDAEYELKLVHAYPSVSSEEWGQYMRIVKKVAFSREAVSDEEMAHCLRCYCKR